MKVYPLKFKPIYKQRIWGGQKLREVLDKNISADEKIGESWELADLPDDKSVITNAEEMHRVIDNCLPPIVVTDCPCRGRTEELGIRECKDKYPIKESCLQLGIFGKYFLDRGAGRELTRKEAHELVDKHAELGLIFTTENVVQANHQIICCCCECCCSLMRGLTRFEDKNEHCTAKSNYISEVNQELCKAA